MSAICRTSEITDAIRNRIPNRLEFDCCEDCGNKLFNPLHMNIRWRVKYKLALCDACVDCRDGLKWIGVPDYSQGQEAKVIDVIKDISHGKMTVVRA